MRLGLSQSARMEQRLVQSPQMIQAMQILQLSSLDLEERVDQELMENPFLEEVEGGSAEEAEAPAEREESAGSEADGVGDMLDMLERYDRDFGDGTRGQRPDVEASDRKLEMMNNTPDRFHSLADALVHQLAFLDLNERQRELAEYVLYSLDHRGYLPETLESVAAQCDIEDVVVSELREILGKLRQALHPSLGCFDLRECLLLQVEAHGIDDPLVQDMIRDHLEDITTNRLPRIVRSTGRDLEEVKEAIELIRHLDPGPTGDFGEEQAAVIHPDVVVEEEGGEYKVRLVRDRSPELRISNVYRQLLLKAKDGDQVQQWIKKRVEAARWFIDAVQQRQNTVLRISNSIFAHQRPFLEKGTSGFQPLRMQEVADEAGVHISTVSRAVAGKYVQTPRGIFPLKYFFSGGTAKSGGGMASQVSIKQRIRELVAEEDPATPHSDDHLAELLAERDGIKIARRTVTKYRKALELPSSSQRRRF
jgi:RNA polymerase sigma-54 factor